MFNVESITGMLEDTDTGLDKIKEHVIDELDELKQEEGIDNVGASIYKAALEGFEKDLAEIGATPEQKNKAIAKFNAKWKESINKDTIESILKSPEKKALDTFISELSNLPLLKDMIESAEPKAKWEVWIQNVPDKYKKMILTIGGLMGFGQETDPSKQGFADRIFNMLKGDSPPTQSKPSDIASEEEDASSPPTPQSTPEPTTEATPESNKLNSDQEAAIQPLVDVGLTIDGNKVEADYKFLTGRGLNQNQIVALATKSMGKDGNLKKLYEEIKAKLVDHIGDMKFELSDAFAFDSTESDKSSNDHITALLAALESNSENTTEKIREILNNAKNKTTDEFKKQYNIS